jgi:aminocarboxymuconate-semialdehyde decarboxylase
MPTADYLFTLFSPSSSSHPTCRVRSCHAQHWLHVLRSATASRRWFFLVSSVRAPLFAHLLPAAMAASSPPSLPASQPSAGRGRRLPRIDVHTHILPEHLPDLAHRYGYGEWVRLEHHAQCSARMYQGDRFFREVEDNCYRAEPRLRDCDDSGVTVQALSTVPVLFSYWAKAEDALDLSRYLNDHIDSIVRQHPQRFIGLATIPMQSAELAVQELRRVMALGSFAGVQIGSHVNDRPLSDPELFPVFQEAERLGAAVFVHPWDMAGSALMSRYWLPWLVGMPAETSFAICSLIFGGVLERLPELRVCFAHGGGSFPGTIGRIEHGFRCRPDLVAVDNNVTPREYCGRFYVDSLTHDRKALRDIVALFGSERVVLGSDYPFPLGEEQPGRIVDEDDELSEEVKAAILWSNAVSFLGMHKREAAWLKGATAAANGAGEEKEEKEDMEEKEDGQSAPPAAAPASSSADESSDDSLRRLHEQLDALNVAVENGSEQYRQADRLALRARTVLLLLLRAAVGGCRCDAEMECIQSVMYYRHRVTD